MDRSRKSINILPWISNGNSSYVPWNNLISVLSGDYLFIIQWNKRQISIFQVHEQEVRNDAFSALKSASPLCQDVNFPEPVLQVFEWSEKLFLLTTSGFLKVFKFDETSIRCLKNGKCCFETILSLPPPKKVLRATPLNGNVLLLAMDLNGYITIDIYNIDTLSDDMEIFLIDSLPLEKQEQQDSNVSVTMCLCNLEIGSELMGAQSNHFIIILVGLNTGSVYWLPFIKNAPVSPQVRKLYHAGRKVREIISPKGSNNAFVLLEGGVAIIFTSSNVKDKSSELFENNHRNLKFNISALPGSIREFCISAKSRNILCSDGIQCWLVKETSDQTGAILLPLRGATGFLALPDSDICLATTKHNTFYTVNANSDFAARDDKDEQSVQKYCDLETPYQYICELKEKTNELLEVETALEVEDSVLAAISAAARGSILRTSFYGRVLVYDVDIHDPFDECARNSPTDTLYKLNIEVKNNSSVDFSASLWNMCILILLRGGGVLSKTVSLQNSFIRAYPFSTNVYVRLQSKDLVPDPKIIVNLIADLPEPDNGRWISIPVIEEDLDLSNFLTVISDLDKGVPKKKAVPIDEQMNKLIQKVPNVGQRTVSYSINIPQHLRNVPDLLQSLLSRSKHRCEDFLKQIKGGTDQREFSFLFGDAVVTIIFNRTVSVLTIASTNTEVVHGVKLWIVRFLVKSGGKDLSSRDIVSKAKGLRSVLEKEQLKSPIDVVHLKEIHNELRNNVSAALPFQ